MNNPKKKVLTGQIWNEFCDGLKKTGSIILNEKLLDSEIDMSEGWRYLTRLTRLGLEMALENSDPYFPTFYSLSHATAKIGADNPDNLYYNATIDGNYKYRIWGDRGSVHYLSFGTKSNRYDKDGTMETTGELDIKNIKINRDGSFEIFLSKEKQEINWLPITEKSNLVIVRQTFLDRTKEEQANIYIESLNAPKKPSPLTSERLVRGLQTASAFVDGTAKNFVGWTNLCKQKPNQLSLKDQTMFQRAGGDPNIYYIHGYWELEEDEVLIIQTNIPSCDYWNFQLDNYWMESLDYRYLRIAINNESATLNEDGTVTIAISAIDPGIKNWIETGGHKLGTMLLRWVNASTFPEPTTFIKKL